MHVKGSLHFIFSPQPPSCSDAQIRLFPQKHRQVRLYWSQSFDLQWCKTTPTHRVTGKTFPGNRVKINNNNNNNGNNNKVRQLAKMFPYFLKWMQITSASLPPPSHAPKAWWGGGTKPTTGNLHSALRRHSGSRAAKQSGWDVYVGLMMLASRDV